MAGLVELDVKDVVGVVDLGGVVISVIVIGNVG
jgi:hypothetical protein